MTGICFIRFIRNSVNWDAYFDNVAWRIFDYLKIVYANVDYINIFSLIIVVAKNLIKIVQLFFSKTLQFSGFFMKNFILVLEN